MNNKTPPDLSRPDILKQQLAIAYEFRKRWNNLIVALLLAFWFGLGFPVTLNCLYPGWDSKIEHALLVATAFIASIAFLIYRMHTYKCPNCKNIPQGEHLSFAGEVHYGKGINLAPKICRSCGSFLSLRGIHKACAAQKQ